jgi:F-type H+-transporting ATPase subunit c
MRDSKKSLRILLLLTVALIVMASLAPALAQDNGENASGAVEVARAGGVLKYQYLGAALGAGMVAIGAGVGIGKLAAAAAEGVARQPQASTQITGAVQLPLFLLEGVAVVAVVTCLLIVLMK